jgi:prepilin-type processing-associated H-X9-DG protein
VQTRDRDFSDGLSNTLFFSERLVGDYATNTSAVDEFTPARDPFLTEAQIETIAEAEAACSSPPSLTPPHDSYGGAPWLYSGWRFTWYNHIRTPNSPSLDCETGIDSNGAVTARSYHPGGVNVAFGDGRARMLANAIDLNLWRALASRANHEPISEF